MQHSKFMKTFAGFAIVVGALACGADGSTQPDVAKLTGASTGGTAPVAGVTTSITLSPHALALNVGWFGSVVATAHDGNGTLITGRRPTWRSSDATIADVVSDSGVVRARAIGTATIYAAMDGVEDAVTVTVSAAPPTSPPVSNPSLATSFTLTLTTVGALPGADTSRVEIVPGTKVTVSRVMGIKGDTLNPAITVATLTTDASGTASLANVPGGYYQFTATPPAGTPYILTSAGIGAPTSSTVNYRLVLQRPR